MVLTEQIFSVWRYEITSLRDHKLLLKDSINVGVFAELVVKVLHNQISENWPKLARYHRGVVSLEVVGPPCLLCI